MGISGQSVSENIVAVAGEAIASVAPPSPALLVPVPSGAAAAAATPPVVVIAVAPTTGVAIAGAGTPTPTVFVDLPAGAAAAASTAPNPIIAVLPPAGVASADMGPINPYNTIGEYLRAALEQLLIAQVLIEADITTAVAAGDIAQRDEGHSRLSACLMAIREVRRAIAIDDQREPYAFVAPDEATALAGATAPLVTAS